MKDCLSFDVPLPPRELSPNYTVGSCGGRLGKARKVKQYRETACLRALSEISVGAYKLPFTRPVVYLKFYVRDRRRRDRDNLLAAMKSAMDGIADAGVVNDDSAFTYMPVSIAVDRENPRVSVLIVDDAAEDNGGGA